MKKCYHFTYRDAKFLIFAPGYMIDMALMRYSKAIEVALAENSRKAYLIQLMKWVNFLYQENPRENLWDLEPETLRRKLYQFLTQEYSCQINFARFHEDAFLVKELGVKNGRAKMFLSAIGDFYKRMNWLKLYNYKNALKIPVEQSQADRVSEPGRIRMPLISGCELPVSSQILPYRLSNNYFVCIDDAWLPKTLDCPDFPELMLKGGKQIGWSLREIIIFRLLFETGARISEVVGITIADWLKFNCKDSARIFSKGSGKARVKTINWSRDTTNLLLHYFNSERKKWDPKGFSLSKYTSTYDHEFLSTIPLFINRYARGVNANSYRSLYWTPAAKAAGIKATPHQPRHWYVTSYIRKVYTERGSDDVNHPDVASDIEGLISYMNWKSGMEMVKVYNHHLARGKQMDYQTKIHEAFKKSLEIKSVSKEINLERPALNLNADPSLQTLFQLVDTL